MGYWIRWYIWLFGMLSMSCWFCSADLAVNIIKSLKSTRKFKSLQSSVADIFNQQPHTITVNSSRSQSTPFNSSINRPLIKRWRKTKDRWFIFNQILGLSSNMIGSYLSRLVHEDTRDYSLLCTMSAPLQHISSSKSYFFDKENYCKTSNLILARVTPFLIRIKQLD